MPILQESRAPRAEMDVLSEALLHARLRGDQARVYGPPAPFHIAFPAGVPRVHFAVSAPLLVHLDGRTQPIMLEPADVVLLGHASAHSIATPDAIEPPRPLSPVDGMAEHGGRTSWLTGTFRVEDDTAAPLLAALPPLVHLSSAAEGNEWQRLSLDLLLAEIGNGRPGSWIMTSRILDLVLVHALRQWAASDEVEPGWLATVLDERLAPALSAMHRDLEHPWSVAELAALTRQAPSTFAHRFTEVVGQTPAAYLTERRMASAARMLESTATPVGRVATAVGYTSEPAFSRAFRRRFGIPPLAWRKQARERS